MAQRQVGATDFAQGGPKPFSLTNMHDQSVHLDENAMVGHPGSSTVGESDTHHAVSTLSQSQTLTPSRGGTLKKRQSLSRKNSFKRSRSKKDSRPGSVKSSTFADDVGGHGSEMHSACELCFLSPSFRGRVAFGVARLAAGVKQFQNMLHDSNLIPIC